MFVRNTVQIQMRTALLAACVFSLAFTGERLSASEGPEGIEWQLTSLGDTPVPTLTSHRRPSLNLDASRNRASGYSGCNNFFGHYALAGVSLTFGQFGATRMACEEVDTNVERKYLDVLSQTRGWKIESGGLLLMKDDEVLARLIRR